MINAENTVLVVDLDGTLLKSDMLYESFWSAVSRNWRNVFFSVAALTRGKAALKSYLMCQAEIDATSLPYDESVIAYVRAYRAKGGKTALVTASNKVFAEHVAKHLQIFDEVHGSDDIQNLKGVNKAAFLIERFGRDAFQYMGDAHADLPVWEASQKIVTVNASQSLRQAAESLGKPIEHLVTTVKTVRSYVKAIRPHQWLKNILIFLPLLAAHQFDPITALSSLVAFVAFSLVASSVYVLNDLLDLNADRGHPRKRLRPFASGAVPIAHGSVLAFALLLSGALVAAFLGWAFWIILGIYYTQTMAYSLVIKRKIVLDICVLAGLYTMRIIAGGVATGIELSVWLLAFACFFFLALAAVKRQAELVDMAERGELTAKGRGYHVADLPIIGALGLVAGYISVLVMALYVDSSAVKELYAFPNTLWGICCVLLYWLTRMVLITHRGSMHDDPVVFAARDRVSQVCFIFILAIALVNGVA